jgi:hypothetical protein
LALTTSQEREMMIAEPLSLRRRRFIWLLLPVLTLAGAIGYATTVLAAIEDTDGAYHSYGGYTCLYGGQSKLDAAGGSSGFAGTVIVTEDCKNGYRELYTQAATTTNQILTHYSGWVLYDTGWIFGSRTDLCQVQGSHRMSKAGIDTSVYVYTAVTGCVPV